MTNFQFTQDYINRLAEAGVEWAFINNSKLCPHRTVREVETLVLGYSSLTPRGLLVGTATDLLEKVYGRPAGVCNIQLLGNGCASHSLAKTGHGKHPTQEENLIYMIVDLSAQLKAKEVPPLTIEQRLERIEKKVGI